MATIDRGFKEINVVPCSAQKGKLRYHPMTRADALAFAPIAWYRCNLTVLSQRCNLLFFAHGDKIHVVKPGFPTQSVSGRPDLILNLPVTRPGLKGHLEPSKPHYVNHLIVGDLGNEEIIVCACDDGDVIAYRTRSIWNAVQQDKLSKSDQVRVMFIQNVAESAWGLAIHKEARLIAVSTNNHQIIVFAFALRRDASPPASDDDDPKDYTTAGDTDWEDPKIYSPHQRSSSNFKITLEGHHDNIPSIAFCNTEDDPLGLYLVSTDIFGVLIVWYIPTRQILKKSCIPPSGGPKSGWGVLCLDPRSFRLSQSSREIFGCIPILSKAGHDISASRKDVEQSDWHPGFGAIQEILPQSPIDEDEISESEGEDSISEDGNSSNIENEDINIEEDESLENTVASGQGPTITPLGILLSHLHEATAPPSTWPALLQTEDAGANMSQPRSTKNTTDKAELQTISGLPPELAIGSKLKDVSSRSLPFDILHTSEADIRLFDNTYFAKGTICDRPLLQHMPPNLHWLHRFHRLNMLAQIPELGIVAVASQVGRVALLTLTRDKSNRVTVGFRLDRILPLQAQEEEELRPSAALMGMAVGPIQGREFVPTTPDTDDGGFLSSGRGEVWRAFEECRRYRLLLTYLDHTVLSYEIGRSGIGEGEKVLVF